MPKEMTVDELKKHIETTVLPMVASVSEKVKDIVAESVSKALTPIQGELTAAQVAQKELTERFKAATTGPSSINGAKKREKGESFGRVVWALRRAKNDPIAAAGILKQTGDDDLAELMKAEAKRFEPEGKSMLAGDPETGGILIPQVVSSEVIDLLRAAVVVRRFNPITLPMPFGNFSLPKVTSGSTAYYVGEGAAATTSKVKTGSVKLSFKKLVTVVPASNDLFRYSSPGADMLIRDDVVRNTAVREDQGFLRDDGVSSTPKSLLQWAIDNARTLNALATVSLANVTTDLGKLILNLVNANVPMTRPGWIMPPRTWNYLMTVLTTNGTYAFRDEMKGGTLWGWPYAYTTQVPITLDTSGAGNSNETDLYLADFADVVIGDSQNLIIDASGDASYEEGGSLKSAFHRDETVIRAITEHDIVMRRAESISVLRRITWGA